MIGKIFVITIVGLAVAVTIGIVCSNGICGFARNMGDNAKRNYTFAKLLLSMRRLLSDDRFFVRTIDERMTVGPNGIDSIARDEEEERQYFATHRIDHSLTSCLYDSTFVAVLRDKVNLSNEIMSNENAQRGYNDWWRHCVITRTRASK